MKAELMQFPGGKYAVRRTRRNKVGIKYFEYLDLSSSTIGACWREESDVKLYKCFSSDLKDVINQYVASGTAPGVVFNAGVGFNLGDFTKMAEMAETDEGMKDLLSQAKEYYILKKK